MVYSLNFNQRQHCGINMLRAASCTNKDTLKAGLSHTSFLFRLHAGHRAEGAAEAHAWLLGVPPTNHLQRRQGGRGPHQ